MPCHTLDMRGRANDVNYCLRLSCHSKGRLWLHVLTCRLATLLVRYTHGGHH